MQCLNKFFSPTYLSPTDTQNSKTKNPSFRARCRTKEVYVSPCSESVCRNASKKAFPLPPNVKNITSTSNPFVKHCLKLRQSSAYRHLHGTVLVVGATPDWLFLLPGCCDPFNDKALRACRGACFQIPIVSGSWEHVGALREEFEMKMVAGHPATINQLKPVKLSQDFADSVSASPLCLVLGSEGTGLSQFSRRACELVTIPMAGEFESLNVSIAGGIFMDMLQHHNNKPA